LIPKLLNGGEVERIVAIDRTATKVRDSRVQRLVGDMRDLDLRRAVEGIDVLVHLAFMTELDHIGDVQQRANREMTQRLLDAAVQVPHLVVLSSATVYGAWPNNPTPITEAALVRPNPGFAYAVHKAEVERMLSAWRGENPNVSVSILRPTVSVAPGEISWLGAHLLAASVIWVGDEDPDWQFLAQEDLVSAIEVAIDRRINGAYNVAPDGYLSSEQRRALLGVRPRFRVSEAIAEFGARWRSRPLPEGIVPYTMHSWVISNSRLRAEGWVPRTTNEEAFVEVDPAPPWASMNAKQKQYLSLAGAGALLTGLLVAVVVLVRRHLRG
ncbi:MAG: NAD-dependent epimerase/dehydratase family protein, partial [Acidimicrobiales bacterium]